MPVGFIHPYGVASIFLYHAMAHCVAAALAEYGVIVPQFVGGQ
jgi:hypothetical protein